MASSSLIFSSTDIAECILWVRGQKVMVDADLAALYQVETRTLTQAVKRNADRFPADFMFQLTQEEFTYLRSQTVISSGWGGRRYPPYVFTEQGVAMLSSVLRSKSAIQVNIEIMRTFVKLRQVLESHQELRKRLDNHDEQFKVVFEAIRQLMQLPEKTSRKAMGFIHGED